MLRTACEYTFALTLSEEAMLNPAASSLAWFIRWPDARRVETRDSESTVLFRFRVALCDAIWLPIVIGTNELPKLQLQGSDRDVSRSLDDTHLDFSRIGYNVLWIERFYL